MSFLKDEIEGKTSSGRLMACSIVYAWLMIAVLVAGYTAVKGDKVTVIDMPWAFAGISVLFYYGRNLDKETIKAVISRFLGIPHAPKT